MPVINDIYSLLRLEEGDKTFVYDDFNGKPITKGSHVYGNPTIGVGRALNISGITQKESDLLLTNDVMKWSGLLQTTGWFDALDVVRKAAIIDMTHALGFAGVRAFHDMIDAIGRYDWTGAYSAVMASTWATEENTRAKRVANMLQTGSWPSV